MKIDEACIGCIINQSSKVASAIKADEVLTEKLISAVTQSSKDFSFSLTPPEVATDVYEFGNGRTLRPYPRYHQICYSRIF